MGGSVAACGPLSGFFFERGNTKLCLGGLHELQIRGKSLYDVCEDVQQGMGGLAGKLAEPLDKASLGSR